MKKTDPTNWAKEVDTKIAEAQYKSKRQSKLRTFDAWMIKTIRRPFFKPIAKCWRRIPTIEELRNDYETRYKTPLRGQIALTAGASIYVFIMLFVPFIMNGTYKSALIGSGLSLTMFIFLMIWCSRQFHPVKNFRGRISTLACLALAVVLLMTGLNTLRPKLDENTDTNVGTKPNTTYLTYSPSCEYCQAAHDATAAANAIYDSSHFSNLEVVNIDKNTKLANALKKDIIHKGSIIHYDKNNKPSQPMTYTTGTTAGPTVPTASYVYWVMTHGDK